MKQQFSIEIIDRLDSLIMNCNKNTRNRLRCMNYMISNNSHKWTLLQMSPKTPQLAPVALEPASPVGLMATYSMRIQ